MPQITPDTDAQLAILAVQLRHHARCNRMCPDSRRIRAEIDHLLDLVLDAAVNPPVRG